MAQSILVQVSAEWANPIKSFDAMSSPEEVKIRFGIYPAYRAWFACVWLVCGDWRGCAVVLTVVLEQRRKLSTIPGTESTTTATTTTATTVTTCQRSRPCLGHWSQPTNTHTHTHKETRSCWPNTTNATLLEIAVQLDITKSLPLTIASNQKPPLSPPPPLPATPPTARWFSETKMKTPCSTVSTSEWLFVWSFACLNPPPTVTKSHHSVATKACVHRFTAERY